MHHVDCCGGFEGGVGIDYLEVDCINALLFGKENIVLGNRHNGARAVGARERPPVLLSCQGGLQGQFLHACHNIAVVYSEAHHRRIVATSGHQDGREQDG